MNNYLSNYNKKIILLLLLILPVFLFNIFLTGCSTEKTGEATVTQKKDPIELKISFVGDIMAHGPQIQSAQIGDSYDFSSSFQYVSDYIENSDLSLCNIEATFAGKPYSGYPLFSAPDQLAQDIKDAGFDVGITANNHMLDKNLDGMKRTVQVISDSGLKVTGSKLEEEDLDYIITEVNGINVGIIAYTYETSRINGSRSMNGNPMSDESRALLNSYDPNNPEQDLAVMKNNIDDARKAGAQVIIFYLHWGQEYDSDPNDTEINVAEKIASYGADMIFASHPHVLQKYEMIETGTEKTVRAVPVFYSMGNFLSNQRADNIGIRKSEQGMIARVKAVFDPNTDTIIDIEAGHIPTWVDKYYSDGKNKYAIIPLNGDYRQNPTLVQSNHAGKAEEASSDIEQLLGKPNELF